MVIKLESGRAFYEWAGQEHELLTDADWRSIGWISDDAPPRTKPATTWSDSVIDFAELITWLRSQIDEDELVAKQDLRRIGAERVAGPVADDLHNYACRVLIQADIQRRLIGDCEEIINGTGWPGLAQTTVRRLAMGYAGKPGYQERWHRP